MNMERSEHRGAMLKLVPIWLGIILLCSFLFSMEGTTGQVSLTAMPEVPKQGNPIVATFKINNPSSGDLVTRYQLYANGKLFTEGAANIAAGMSQTYRYAYENTLQIGEQVTFMARTQSELGNDEINVSIPPYAPQIWSSFVSFASFSTSLMGSNGAMGSMTYYQSTFGIDALNVGVVITMVLLLLLIFRELTQPVLARSGTMATWARLRIKFSTLTWILLLIFIGLIFTRTAMILAG